jgi:gas vesicle protein
MQDKSGNMIGGLPWFFTGLGAGLSLGILFAPQSGEESRRLIRNKAQDGNDLLKSSVAQGQEYIKRQGKELLDEANELIDRGKNAVKQQKDQLSAAIEAGKEAYRSYVK